MRKPRHRVAKKLVQGHTFSKQWSCAMNPSGLTAEPTLYLGYSISVFFLHERKNSPAYSRYLLNIVVKQVK